MTAISKGRSRIAESLPTFAWDRLVRSLLPLLLATGGLWAVVPQIWQRWVAPWGSSWGGIVLLGTLIAWANRMVQSRGKSSGLADCATPWFVLTIAGLGLYAVLYNSVPQLVACELAAGTLAALMLGSLAPRQRAQSWGLVSLMLLSVHVTSSVQFFAGYPLRVLVGYVSSFLMGKSTYPVGTGLTDGVITVFIDAPCSGVRMLTTSLVLAGALAVFLRLNFRRTLTLHALGVILAILGNAQRAATLFILRRGFDELHVFVGIFVFVECSLLLWWFGRILGRRKKKPEYPVANFNSRPGWRRPVFLLACGAACLSPLLPENVPAQAPAAPVEVVWPKRWHGEKLVSIPLSPNVKEHLRGFPGQFAQFRLESSGRRILLRHCSEPTRQLHSAENCYMGRGRRLKPFPAWKDGAGHLWSRFRVIEEGEGKSFVVRQCYFAIDPAMASPDLEEWIKGVPSWPDVSSWYWAASKPNSGVDLTLAVTIVD